MATNSFVRFAAWPLCLLSSALSVQSEFSISKDGKANCTIVRQAGATPPEQSAIRELTNTLHQITGGDFNVADTKPKSSERVIIIGPGVLAAEYFPEFDLATLGPEEFVMRVKGQQLLVAGGRPR